MDCHFVGTLPFWKGKREKPVNTNAKQGSGLMKLGIVLSTNDPEEVWNVFRFGNVALKETMP